MIMWDTWEGGQSNCAPRLCLVETTSSRTNRWLRTSHCQPVYGVGPIHGRVHPFLGTSQQHPDPQKYCDLENIEFDVPARIRAQVMALRAHERWRSDLIATFQRQSKRRRMLRYEGGDFKAGENAVHQTLRYATASAWLKPIPAVNQQRNGHSLVFFNETFAFLLGIDLIFSFSFVA